MTAPTPPVALKAKQGPTPASAILATQAMLEHAFRNVEPDALINVDFFQVARHLADHAEAEVAIALAAVVTPDAAAMRDDHRDQLASIYTRGYREGCEDSEQPVDGTSLADGVSQVVAEFDEGKFALPLASTEAGIGAGEGEVALYDRYPEEGTCSACGKYVRDKYACCREDQPPAALDEHRAREVEEQAWEWLEGRSSYDPRDRDHSADEVVDAFIAGRATSPRASGDGLREAVDAMQARVDGWRAAATAQGRKPGQLVHGYEDALTTILLPALRSDDAEAG